MFPHFNLRWQQGIIEIKGDWAGAQRLRLWVFGNKKISYKGYVAEGDEGLLQKIAESHALLLDKEQSAAQILKLAARAGDRVDFEGRLTNL